VVVVGMGYYEVFNLIKPIPELFNNIRGAATNIDYKRTTTHIQEEGDLTSMRVYSRSRPSQYNLNARQNLHPGGGSAYVVL